MRIDSFDWDAGNRVHIARHSVMSYEVEEVILFDRPIYLKGPNDRYYLYGVADSGRYLFVVFAVRFNTTIRVITARNMSWKERNYYKKRR